MAWIVRHWPILTMAGAVLIGWGQLTNASDTMKSDIEKLTAALAAEAEIRAKADKENEDDLDELGEAVHSIDKNVLTLRGEQRASDVRQQQRYDRVIETLNDLKATIRGVVRN